MEHNSGPPPSRALAVSPQTDSVRFRDLVHTLVPGGIPIFLVLLHRYVKKHTSAYVRAGIISMGVGLYISRVFQGYLTKIVKDYFMCGAELRNGDDGYEMLLSWISRQSFSQNSRNFLATCGPEMSRNDRIRSMIMHDYPGRVTDVTRPNALRCTPAYGTYPFWFKSNLYFFSRREISRENGSNDALSLSCFGRNPMRIKKLLDQCREEYNALDKGKTVIYTAKPRYGECIWTRGLSRKSRPFSSVVLDSGVKTSIINDLENYLSAQQQDWYAARGIPYRRGYLLFGPPGTGKSSLSFAIAGYFELNIYIVSLNSSKITDDLLEHMFATLPSKCLVLMEDIDAAGITDQRTAMPGREGYRSGVSLSALLNVIDGVASQEGRVLIMTTNHIEKLDSALIRPGRVDMMVRFTNAEKPQLIQIFKGIFLGIEDYTAEKERKPATDSDASKSASTNPDPEKLTADKAHADNISSLAEQFADRIPGGTFSPAEIQGYLLKWKDAPEKAVEHAVRWSSGILEYRAKAKAAEEAEQMAVEKKRVNDTAMANAQAFQQMQMMAVPKVVSNSKKKEQVAKEKGEGGTKEEVAGDRVPVNRDEMGPVPGGELDDYDSSDEDDGPYDGPFTIGVREAL